jgi:hypothetical protein
VLRHRAAKHSSEVYDRETNKKLEFITQLTLEYLYVSLKKKRAFINIFWNKGGFLINNGYTKQTINKAKYDASYAYYGDKFKRNTQFRPGRIGINGIKHGRYKFINYYY